MYQLLNLFCIGTALVAAVTHSKSINISDECRITFMRCISYKHESYYLNEKEK